LDHRLFFPASQRNKKFIGDFLSTISLKKGFILEIGSGSGEHAIEFQKRFPEIIWQTSDPDLDHRKSIWSWIVHENLNNKMPKPLEIDVTKTPWIISTEIYNSLQGIISINMIHIASWECTKSLFRESGKLLKNGRFLILYGPFKINNEHTSESNALFDKSLKMQNWNWGVRNLEDVYEEGKKNGFTQYDLIQMPANNYIVIFRKVSLRT
tara:strand:+ start:1113 stop:1742 length:630 start_codon:yes stop_codon:yes gene_type:complete